MKRSLDWTIRSAAPNDAAAIAGILRDCWPDDTPDIERITSLLTTSTNSTLCAVRAGEVIGLTYSFTAPLESGRLRLEVDLLAVYSAARGQGIGKALLRRMVKKAPRKTSVARGLVRIGNIASERAFASAGFAPGVRTLTLWTATADPRAPQDEYGSALIVETLTYSGLWLDPPFTMRAMAAARGMAAAYGLDRVGALVSEADESDAARRAGYQCAGQFRWWIRIF